MTELNDRELEGHCAGKALAQDARNTMAALRRNVERVGKSAEGLSASGASAAASLESSAADLRKLLR